MKVGEFSISEQTHEEFAFQIESHIERQLFEGCSIIPYVNLCALASFPSKLLLVSMFGDTVVLKPFSCAHWP